MKKKILFLFVLWTLGTITLLAQAPPKPPNDPSLGGSNGPVGGGGGPTGAPIDGGLGVFLLLGTAYGLRKVIGRKNK